MELNDVNKNKCMGTGIKVLLVDDSSFVLKQLQQILISENFTIVGTAENGEEALALYKKFKPNLVTMDITMPKMDGIVSLSKIMEYDKDAKVVMISALGKEDIVKKALLLGAKNYITKPLDRKKVLERIKNVIAKK